MIFIFRQISGCASDTAKPDMPFTIIQINILVGLKAKEPVGKSIMLKRGIFYLNF